MSKKRGLGRGLGSLISTSKPSSQQTSQPDEQEIESSISDSKGNSNSDSNLKNLPVELIVRGIYQPRRDMEESALEELSASIKAKGLLQPVVVRQLSANKYELIAGERRWRASQLAGLVKIPALIKEVSDEDTAALSLIENIQRENLNPIEEAFAYQRLQDDFNLTQQDVADAVGKSRSAVANIIRLLKLNNEVIEYLERGDLEMGHARAMLSLEDKEQVKAAEDVINKTLNVRQTEDLVKKMQLPKKETPAKKIDPNISQLEELLAQKIGANVAIKQGKKGGSLTIKYSDLNELDGILARIH
jgi:ParB family transcriptional regulator, chromosome partitioning protein